MLYFLHPALISPQDVTERKRVRGICGKCYLMAFIQQTAVNSIKPFPLSLNILHCREGLCELYCLCMVMYLCGKKQMFTWHHVASRTSRCAYIKFRKLQLQSLLLGFQTAAESWTTPESKSEERRVPNCFGIVHKDLLVITFYEFYTF